ncbi:DUF4124 domain-containing protein [Azonexus sp.]|uniref:DUF4124 domain-containing protein n=1 Tax=Azonexus sp. TaxID=1872668 RepID=UPI0039E326B8
MRSIILALIVAPSLAFAGATKCRDAAGKVFITDGLCPGSSRVERVQHREYIPQERLISAQRLREKNRAKVDAIEAERDFEIAEGRLRAAEANRRNEEIRMAREGREQEQRKMDECTRLAKMGRKARHEAMAKGCEWGFEAERTAQHNRAAREQAQNQPPALITNCDSSGCWDTRGVRYNNAGGGSTYRQDGRFCQQVGGMLHCN